MESENYSLNEFITEKMFLNLASCILLVAGMTELFKQYIDINPLLINLIMSAIVTLVRIAIVGDFSFNSNFTRGNRML